MSGVSSSDGENKSRKKVMEEILTHLIDFFLILLLIV